MEYSDKYLSFVVVLGFFPLSCCRGRLNSPVLAERSRIAAKPGFGQKVQRFTPALGLTQSRGKNRTFLMKTHTEEVLQVTAGFLGGRSFDICVENQIYNPGCFLS